MWTTTVWLCFTVSALELPLNIASQPACRNDYCCICGCPCETVPESCRCTQNTTRCYMTRCNNVCPPPDDLNLCWPRGFANLLCCLPTETSLATENTSGVVPTTQTTQSRWSSRSSVLVTTQHQSSSLSTSQLNNTNLTPAASSRKPWKVGVAVGVSVGGVLLIALVLIIMILIISRRRRHQVRRTASPLAATSATNPYSTLPPSGESHTCEKMDYILADGHQLTATSTAPPHAQVTSGYEEAESVSTYPRQANGDGGAVYDNHSAADVTYNTDVITLIDNSMYSCAATGLPSDKLAAADVSNYDVTLIDNSMYAASAGRSSDVRPSSSINYDHFTVIDNSMYDSSPDQTGQSAEPPLNTPDYEHVTVIDNALYDRRPDI